MPSLLHPVRRSRFALTPLALCVAGVWQVGGVHAQDASGPLPAPRLSATPLLREVIPEPLRRQLPTHVEGESMTGRTELDTRIEGNAMLRRGDTVIRADRIDYRQPDDMARATGNVRINRAGDRYEGPLLELKVEAFQGFFNEPRFRLLRNEAQGQASRIDFLDDQHAIIHNATYTTCQRQPGPSWLPEWQLTAETLRIDNEQEVGYATNAVLRFQGVPVLPVPSLSFPLSSKRKSGLLPPTLAVDNISGVTVIQPYYWNIAPNRDLTVSPTYMSKRGLDLGAEFRYLEPTYRGILRSSYLPGDNLRSRDRWSFNLRHTDRMLPIGLPGNVGLNLDLNRVSDNDFWRDFTNRNNPVLTQRLLVNDAALTWGQGPVSVQVRTQKWQTLQDVSSPITPPYDRLPQIVTRYTENRLPGGLRASVEADFTHFQAGNLLAGQTMPWPDAQRTVLSTQLSRPWQTPGVFLTPRLRLHTRNYQFSAPLPTGERSAQVTVPTFSLDSGLIFERELGAFGRDLMQTLEPRAYYVYTPYRAQNFLPNYDSGGNDFTFATIFSDNTYGGQDRIADNNLLTLGLTSRLQDAGTGAELARVGVAQRLRFTDQLITLDPGGTPVRERISDILVGGAVNWTREWATDATVQYNPKIGRSVRSTIGGRYNPTPYRVVSAAYRLQREQSEQLDIGWQWPINDLWGDRGQDLGPGRGLGGRRWYSVGRINTSLREGRVVDAIVGLEYDGCCWIGRVVLERLKTGAGTGMANVRLLFQIEFVGFGRLGTNALTPLRDNIPRYQYLRDQVAPPSRFTQYD